MKTRYYTNSRGEHQAETMTETDANGHAWQISTFKGSGGMVSCSAIQGQSERNGAFSYDMFGAKKLQLSSEKTKATEAAIKRVHEAGLIEFSKVVQEQPETTKPAYVIGVGQIIFTDGVGEERERVIYEVEKPGHFKTVTLDGKELHRENHIKPYSQKFGIGTYYNEGELMELEEVNNLVIAATEYTEKRMEAEDKAREEAAIDRANKIEEGKKIISVIPASAKNVIVGIRFSTSYDPHADYDSHPEHNEETVYLAWSTHTRDIFSEMRKAAENYEKTQHLGTGKGIFKTYQLNTEARYAERGEEFTTEPEAIEYVAAKNAEPQPEGYKWEFSSEDIEHREKYSMGSGYYLKGGEWKVRKSDIDGRSLEEMQIAAAEGRFFCNVQPERTGAIEATPATPGSVQIVDYSEKALAVIGDTYPIKDKLKGLGGRFNKFLSCGPGWIFSKTQLEELKTALSAPQGEAEAIPEPEEIREAAIEAEAAELIPTPEIEVKRELPTVAEIQQGVREEIQKTVELFKEMDIKAHGEVQPNTLRLENGQNISRPVNNVQQSQLFNFVNA